MRRCTSWTMQIPENKDISQWEIRLVGVPGGQRIEGSYCYELV